MRVALVTDGIWPYVLGGMQKHSYYLCKYLAKNQIHVDLFHFNQSTYDIQQLEFFSEEEKKYIHATTVDFPRSAVPFPGHYIYDSWRHSKRVYQALKTQIDRYDFIYTKGFTGWYLIDRKSAGKINCAPIGVKFHGYEMFQKPPDLKTKLQHLLLLRRPVRHISQNADLVFSYGGKISDLIRAIGVPAERMVELPSGVEASALASETRPVGDKIKFVFLGRYERRKGIEELNTALRWLLSENKFQNAEFHFIGPIPADRRISGEALIYHGEIRSKEGLQELLRKCDVLLCPSWSEGLPNVILEAMANGLAVIGTDVGATNVVLNDTNGWLLESSDPRRIADAIAGVISGEREKTEQKKKAALATMRDHFTWEQLIERLIVYLRNVPKKK